MSRRPTLLQWATEHLRSAAGGARAAACRLFETHSRHDRDPEGGTAAHHRAARNIVAHVTLQRGLRDPGETVILDLPGTATLADLDFYARRALLEQLDRTAPHIARVEIDLPRARILPTLIAPTPPPLPDNADETPRLKGERICDFARLDPGLEPGANIHDFDAAWRAAILGKPGDPQP